MSTLNDSTRQFIRRIASEQGITFAQAMKDHGHVSAEIRDIAMVLADEDKTTVLQAKRGYENLQAYLKTTLMILQKEARAKPDAKINPTAELRDIKRRIMQTRVALGCSLAAAVRLFGSDDTYTPEPSNRSVRPCREPGCRRKTKATSYYWCDKHLRDWGTEDSDTMYCPTLSNGDSEAIKAGVKRMAEKIEAEKVRVSSEKV